MDFGVATLLQTSAPALLGGVGVLVAALIVARTIDRRRRGRIAALARSFELNFNPDDDRDIPHRYRRLTLMREGHARRAWNVIGGSARRGALQCFCFRYDVGFGANRGVRTWIVAVLECDRTWGRVACQRPSHGTTDNGPTDAGGRTPSDNATVRSQHTVGDWTITRPPTHRALSLPPDLLGWLEREEQDKEEICLELCDRLVALQVPMEDSLAQMRWLIPKLQEVVQRLEAHGQHDARQDAAQCRADVTNAATMPNAPTTGDTDARA